MEEKRILSYAIDGATAKLRAACADFASGAENPFKEMRKVERIECAIRELKELEQKYKVATAGEQSDDDLLRDVMRRKYKEANT